MRVTIVGGGLQGVELCWLARKAGWETLLVDERSSPPALRLADVFAQCDVTKLGGSGVLTRKVEHQILGTDIVIPALENAAALAALLRAALDEVREDDAAAGIKHADALRPVELVGGEAQHVDVHLIDVDLHVARRLDGIGVEGSGSRGVRLLSDEAELRAYIPEGFDAEGWVLESYCPGPSFSLEICGTPGNYRIFQVTDLLMDEAFDCRGVVAPTGSSPSFVREMEAALLNLAEMLRLHGLMDLEVIQTPEGMRVLEIDARFPSQTPTAVWLSTGINLAEHLAACFFPYAPGSGLGAPRFARYEHVLCKDGGLHFLGEHIMGQFGPLEPVNGFCGADEALVGGSLLSGSWAATLMFAGQDAEDVASRRSDCIEHLRELAERQTGKTIFKG